MTVRLRREGGALVMSVLLPNTAVDEDVARAYEDIARALLKRDQLEQLHEGAVRRHEPLHGGLDDGVGRSIPPLSSHAVSEDIAYALRDIVRNPIAWRRRGEEGQNPVHTG